MERIWERGVVVGGGGVVGGVGEVGEVGEVKEGLRGADRVVGGV